METSSRALDAAHSRLVARFGSRIAPWWQRLPELLATLAERWGLVIADPIGYGNTSLVLRCRCRDGRPGVLKLTPDPALVGAEALALRAWAASGRVPLVWGDDAHLGALLLEALPSETPIMDTDFDVRLADIATLIRALHSAGSRALPNLEPLCARVDFIFTHWIERHRTNPVAARGAVPAADLRRGHELARRLGADGGVPVLLHGDLHPGNVLYGGQTRGLVAIDPRPCVGDATFDAIDWVFWTSEDSREWERRCERLASLLEVGQARLWAWCVAFAALRAASEAARGRAPEKVEALMSLAL